MKRIIYLVCIHLLCSTAAQASNLRQISSREGISNNAILSLAQDKHGFIWVGSCDGLNMWDGERMRLFPNDWGEYTPLSGNLIEEIAVTTDSLFWIRTNYGLDLFDPDSKHVEPHTCFQGMYRVVTRSSDEVIVITQDNKFRYYDPKTGNYISQDPIGLAGGNPTLYGYVFDPNTQIDPLGLDCGKATKKGHQYERRIRALYGDTPFNSRKYTAIINGEIVSGVADNITKIGGKNTAIEAKYVKDWSKSIRNPNSKIGNKPFAIVEQQNMLSQAQKYSAAFPGGVTYHTNSPELASHYTKVFQDAGINNFKFEITP